MRENKYLEVGDLDSGDYIYPILFLTIMNSQSKKYNTLCHCYHIATSIYILNILNNECEYTENYEDINIVSGILKSSKAITNNMKNIKNCTDKKGSFDMFYFIMNMYHKYVNDKYILNYPNIQITDQLPNNEIDKWYLKKKNMEMNSKFKQVDKESYNDYLNRKIYPISEMAIVMGWLTGSGSVQQLDKLKRLAKYFSIMYKFYKDFKSLDSDLESLDEYKKNYIINFGLQESYELFMYNKQKFIEESMELDIYTYTLREIIESVETVIDDVIDNTSPDLKSNFSNLV